MINCVEKPACKNSNHCKRTSLFTAKEAWSLVTQISELPGELVKVSTFCLLPTSGLSNLKALLFHKNVSNDALPTLLVSWPTNARMSATRDKQNTMNYIPNAIK